MSRRGWLLFSTLSLVWGIPYLLIRVAVEHISPTVLVCTRTALGAALLLPIAAARGVLGPVLGRWRWVVVFAVAEIGVPFVMLGHAERRLTSSLTALLIASIPFVALVLVRLLGLEGRIERRRILGLAIGIGGVAALAGLDLRGGDLLAVGAVALTVMGYALGPIIVSTRLRDVSGLGVSAVALALNAVAYAPFAWATRPADLGAVPARTWFAVAGLGIVCTALAFLAFFALVAEVGPSRTTVITFINPAVAVLLGVALLDEPVTRGLLVGFPLILAGSWLATRGQPERPGVDRTAPSRTA